MKKTKISLMTVIVCVCIFMITQLSIAMNEFALRIKPYSKPVRKSLNNCSLADIKRLIDFKEIPPGTRYGTGHNYVYSRLMRILELVPEILNITGCEDYYSPNYINILQYLEVVSHPRPGDIVVYLSNHYDITHTGIIGENGRIQSKWGCVSLELEHDVWQVPEIYGDKIIIYRLEKGGQELLELVQKKVSEPDIAEKYHKMALKEQKKLFKYAARRTYGIDTRDKKDVSKIYNLLESQMNVDINIPQKNGKTALMLAVLAGNIASVAFLLCYKPNIDHQDKSGNTALLYALKNKHFSIASFLIAHGAKQAIKNKKNETVYMYYYKYYLLSCAMLAYIIQNCAHKYIVRYVQEKRTI